MAKLRPRTQPDMGEPKNAKDARGWWVTRILAAEAAGQEPVYPPENSWLHVAVMGDLLHATGGAA